MSLSSIPIPGPISTLFTTFPLKTYPSIDINDTSLENELITRTYNFQKKINDKDSINNYSFTLLIKNKPINWHQSPIYICIDPIELFIQLSLCYKNNITLPIKHDNDAANDLNLVDSKMLIVDRPNLPSMIIGNRMIYKKEILANLKLRFVGIQLQLANLLDKDLYPLFQGIHTDNVIERAKQTLLQFVKFIESKHNQTHYNKLQNHDEKEYLNYLDIKLTSYVLTLLKSDKIDSDFKNFIKESCHNVRIIAEVTLKRLNPELQPY